MTMPESTASACSNTMPVVFVFFRFIGYNGNTKHGSEEEQMKYHAWLQKLICLLALLSLMLPVLPVIGLSEEMQAIYRAKSNTSFHLRPEPESRRWVEEVPANREVEVLEYHEGWSLLRYRKKTGYAQTDWLREFICLDPLNHPLPGFTPCTGIWTFSSSWTASAGEFTGLEMPEGTAVAVRMDGDRAILPVWRDETDVPSSSGSYTPFVPWDSAGKGDLIAAFTTFYNDSTGTPLARERQYNIAYGCSLTDGIVLNPGDSYSFNAICGPYTINNGYKNAKNISASGTGPGGGVCQLSTTLYNALLEVPVQITDWAVHSSSGVRYVPVSYDACVGNYTDLCFTNSLPYPIEIRAMPQDGALTVLIFRSGSRIITVKFGK